MKAIDLFAGAGGVEQGILLASPLAVVKGVEIDPTANATGKLAGLDRIEADVRDVDLSQFSNIDYLHASPPCQGLSLAGPGHGRKDKDMLIEAIQSAHTTKYDKMIGEFEKISNSPISVLILEPIRWITALNPESISLEQVVTGLPIWKAYETYLQKLGYHTWSGVLNSECYGVPQTRRRAYLLASKKHRVGKPTPTHSKYHQRSPWRLDPGVKPWVAMADALGWAGYTQNGNDSVYWEFGDTMFARGTRRFVELPAPTIPSSFDNDNFQFNIIEDAPGHPSGAQWNRNRPPLTINGKPVATPPGTENRRYKGSRTAKTDATRMTPEEAGVLQGFSHDYPWQGTKKQKFTQIGNAVPPQMAAAVVKELRR